MHLFTVVKFNLSTLLLATFVALAIGYALGYLLRKLFTEYQIKEAEELSRKIVKEAEREGKNRLKAAEIEGKEKQIVAMARVDKEIKAKQEESR
ncbi:MAG: Rnase Y domain-containing protein, partial [Nitrospinaceae bacterium]